MTSDFIKDYVIYEEPKRIVRNVSKIDLLKKSKKKKRRLSPSDYSLASFMR